MKTNRSTMTSSKLIVLIAAILATSFLASASIAAPETEKAAKQQDAPETPQPGQKQFDTPKQAADALIQVATNLDVAAAKEILGPDGEDLVSSEDPVMDKSERRNLQRRQKKRCQSKPARKLQTKPYW